MCYLICLPVYGVYMIATKYWDTCSRRLVDRLCLSEKLFLKKKSDGTILSFRESGTENSLKQPSCLGSNGCLDSLVKKDFRKRQKKVNT